MSDLKEQLNQMVNPRMKSDIKSSLINYLYDYPTYKLFSERSLLIGTNTRIMGYSHESFIYKGELYANNHKNVPKKPNKLAPELEETLLNYLRKIKELNDEITKVSGYITNMLNISNSFTDYFVLFPECLHSIIQEQSTKYQLHTPRSALNLLNIVKYNEEYIQLIKQRLLINLIT